MAEYIDTSTEINIWDICEDGAVHFVKTTVAQFLLGHLKCNDLINGIPTADVQPVVHGKWIEVDEQPYFRKHFHTKVCSVCRMKKDGNWSYCPNCGSKMD